MLEIFNLIKVLSKVNSGFWLPAYTSIQQVSRESGQPVQQSCTDAAEERLMLNAITAVCVSGGN